MGVDHALKKRLAEAAAYGLTGGRDTFRSPES